MQISSELPYVCVLRDENRSPVVFEIETINDFPYWEQDWYKIGSGANSLQWTEPYLEEATKRKLISGVQKLKDSSGQFIGVSGIDIHLDQIEEHIKNINLDNRGFSFLLSETGKYIYHPDKNFVLTKNIHDKNVYMLFFI